MTQRLMSFLCGMEHPPLKRQVAFVALALTPTVLLRTHGVMASTSQTMRPPVQDILEQASL